MRITEIWPLWNKSAVNFVYICMMNKTFNSVPRFVAMALALVMAVPANAVFATSPMPPTYVIETRHGVQSYENPSYTLDLFWPEMVANAANADKANAFNSLVMSVIRPEIDGIIEIAKESEGLDMPSGVVSGLWMSYTLFMQTNDIASVRLEFSPYAKGAAHPNHYSRSINFDMNTGKEMTLADVFKPKINPLRMMSAYATANLKARDLLLFPEGALPTPENYRVWNLSPKGIVMTFDHYQVMPYAAGMQEVTMPYRAVKTYLWPNSALAKLAK